MERIERILVIVPAQLGDVLITTPLIRAARRRWPHARIDVLGFAGTLELLRGNPDVTGLIEITRDKRLKAQLRQAASLWRRYDLAFVTRPTDRAHLFGLVAAPLRSGIAPAAGQPGSRWKRWAMRHGFEWREGEHFVMRKLALIAPWTALPDAVELVPPPAEPLPAEVASLLRRPRVVMHVPSSWTYKQWPVAHYRWLAERLVADGVQVVLTGSPSAQDRALVDAVRAAGAPPDVIDVSGRASLPQVRTLLEGSDAYVGPDASVTHLAAALDMPVVTVYGPSLPDAFGPWPQGHAPAQPWQRRAQRQQVRGIVMLQGEDLPGQRCVPCGRMGCDDHHGSRSHCLDTLAPERVLDELRRMLGRDRRTTSGAGG